MNLSLKLGVLLLGLAACGSGAGAAMSAAQYQRLRTGGGFPVTAVDMWTSRSQVPARYQHTIDWHGWSGPVNVVYSGPYVCVNLTDAEWALVQIGDRPGSCRWHSPRGVL